MSQSIQFLGAARTVTGSRHLLRLNGKKVLVDCGSFQGSHELQERNRQPFSFQPSELDAVVITHAHQDHIGLLPRLVREGYAGPIYATRATVELARISLPDSGRIQEEDARHENKHRSPDRAPIAPLYTEADAFACLKHFQPVHYGELNPLPGGAQWRFLPAGHILGSAFAEIYFQNGERILMSGDLGRYDTPIIKDPTIVDFAEYLVMESTYGDRVHPAESPTDKLALMLNEAVQNGSALLVPSFAIGRTQELLYYISKLQSEGKAPRIPIFVDSPMATTTTHVYQNAAEEHDPETQEALSHHIDFLEPQGLHFVKDREQSKALNSQKGPMMIISGSGMANGGRIVHHLMHRLGDPSTTVLFTGYQAEGTLGRRLLDGAPMVRMFGQEIEVAARIERLNALSAHADQQEMLRWLGHFKAAPRKLYLVHGEYEVQQIFAEKIRAELGWNVEIPSPGEQHDL